MPARAKAGGSHSRSHGSESRSNQPPRVMWPSPSHGVHHEERQVQRQGRHPHHHHRPQGAPLALQHRQVPQHRLDRGQRQRGRLPRHQAGRQLLHGGPQGSPGLITDTDTAATPYPNERGRAQERNGRQHRSTLQRARLCASSGQTPIKAGGCFFLQGS